MLVHELVMEQGMGGVAVPWSPPSTFPSPPLPALPPLPAPPAPPPLPPVSATPDVPALPPVPTPPTLVPPVPPALMCPPPTPPAPLVIGSLPQLSHALLAARKRRNVVRIIRASRGCRTDLQWMSAR